MPGALPAINNGAVIIRDMSGACLDPPNVSNAYCPPITFEATCELTALPDNCVGKIMPSQINGIVSELLCLASELCPDGTWNCESSCNLASAFVCWASSNNSVVDGTTIQGSGTLLDPWHVNPPALISADAGNNLIEGADGFLYVDTAAGNTQEAPLDGQQYGRQMGAWTPIAVLTDAMLFKGIIDASTNPNYPASDAGDTYRISVAGKIGGAAGINVEVGDLITSIADATPSGDQATVGAQWTITQANIDGAVIGPAASINDSIALFDGVSGKLLKDSGVTLADFATPASVATAVAVKAPMHGFLYGVGMANGVVSANYGIIVYPGTVADDTNSLLITLPAQIEKLVNVNWAVGDNQGGRRTGMPAFGTAHVFLIYRSDTGVVDVWLDDSMTPTLPAGYTHKRRIGSLFYNGPVDKFIQDGDTFVRSSPQGDVNETSTGNAAVLRTMRVPQGLRLKVRISVALLTTASGAGAGYVWITDPLHYDGAPTSNYFNAYMQVLVTGLGQAGAGDEIECMTNTAAQVRTRTMQSSANATLVMLCTAWIDRRGRDAP